MNLYKKVLSNEAYIKTVNKIESIKFITDGKWDWEHGLGHYKRVAKFAEQILKQLNADDRTIDLAMTASLLHDIGLVKGNKVDHALESSKLFIDFIESSDIKHEEELILRQAIRDHSNGNEIKSSIGLTLVLADKLDVTYHRTINSSIQDKTNKEIQKIKNVDINITNQELILTYTTDIDFDINVLKEWKKAINIPYKVANYLNKSFIFYINDNLIDYSDFLGKKG